MTRLSIKAVLVGNVVDMGATLIAAIPIYAWLGFRAGVTSYNGPEAEAIGTPETIGAAWFSLMLFLGCVCSVIGGYVAARIARHRPMLHGALAASFCFFTGAYALVSGSDAVPQLLQLLVMPLGPALGALGGAAWVRWPLHARTFVVRRSSIIRRAAVAAGYSALALSIAGVASALLLSSECLEQSACSPRETFTSMMVGWFLLAGLILVLWTSASGRILGARHVRSARPVDEVQSGELTAV